MLRLAVLLYLAPVPWAAPQADLRKEDLRAIRAVLREADPTLDWFRVLAKKPLESKDAAGAPDSIMAVEAAPQQPRREDAGTHIAVLVVSGTQNQVRLVLDTFPHTGMARTPVIETGGADRAYLHFYSDYGMYQGSINHPGSIP